MRLRALSQDIEIERLISAGPVNGGILSVHDEALYLQTRDGKIIVLAKTVIGNGPKFVLIAHDGSFKGEPFLIRSDDIFEADNRVITIGGGRIVIQCEDAEKWDPSLGCLRPRPLCEIRVRVDAAVRAVREGKTGGGLVPFFRSIDEFFLNEGKGGGGAGGPTSIVKGRLNSFARALSPRRRGELKEAVRMIIGLGDGLTPSCDDMLVGFIGFMYGLRHMPSHESFAAGILSCIAQVVEGEGGRTNPLSAHFLREAVRGRFTEHLKKFIQALFMLSDKNVETAARRVLEYGATSGADVIFGSALAFKAVIARQ
jgi:hypothetical protein